MPANILRERVRRAIWELIDKGAWEHCQRIERAEIESLRGFHAQWRSAVQQFETGPNLQEGTP